jgi:serine/threonine-protein kinase HipA
MEDFAQVFAVGDKYDSTLNYQSIAYVIWQEVGLDGVLEYVRRLVHMVLTGNADMHLKNWSLVYPDGIHAQLAPAYDFVSTVVYPEIDKALPFKLSAIRDLHRIDLETFRKLSTIAKLPERPVVNTVIETVAALRQQWRDCKNDLPIPKSYVSSIGEHMESVPLSRSC